MGVSRGLVLALALVACCLQAQGVDKYTDENRPYEFGFNIEGEQHRHEKKDENGLIEGEFGFITADGVYHVTVYATDENGNFRILSTKNIRVKPYPSGFDVRQGKALPAQPFQQQPQSQVTQPQPVAPPTQVALEPPARSCSHCSLPTTQAPAPVQNPNYNVENQQGQYGNNQNFGGQPASYGSQGDFNNNQPEIHGAQGSNGGSDFVVNQLDSRFDSAGSPQATPDNSDYGQGQFGPQGNQNYFQNPQYQTPEASFNGQAQPGFETPQYPQDGFQNGQNQEQAGPSYNDQSEGTYGQRNPKQFEPNYNDNAAANPNYPSQPTLISAQMKIVDKETDINSLGQGEYRGLPKGVTETNVQTLLYTFNYTVGFHGHHEEGYASGAKKGYYYVTGRNGVRTRIDYEADENGFRPKITQEVLDFISDEVPKPETEKEEKYGLKHYEFRWIYFPTNSS